MRDVQTCGQCHGHSNAGNLSTSNQCLTNGIQNNESTVTEYGDGYNPAHELHGQLRVLLADQLDHDVSQFQCRTGNLQNGSDQSTEDNYDTDRAEGTGETCTDNVGDAGKRDTCDQCQYKRHTHDRQEGMQFELGNRHDHDNDSQHKCNNEG